MLHLRLKLAIVGFCTDQVTLIKSDHQQTQSENRISQTPPITINSSLELKLFNVGDSITSSGRPLQKILRKPNKLALSFVLQYLFWIIKQCPLISNVLVPASGSIHDTIRYDTIR